MHLARQQAAGRREQRDRLEQVARHQRDVDVELERARHAADRDRGVVADHLRGDLRDDLADHRVDLAGHDRGALLQLRQDQLAEPGARPGAHPADVVRDLRERGGDDLERARGLDQRVAVGLRLEVVERRGDRQPRVRRPAARAPAGRTRGACSARCRSAVPPSGIWPSRGSASSTRARAEPHLRGVAAELLAERHGHGVHEVRAAGLDDLRRTPRPWPRAPPRARRARAAGRWSPHRAPRGARPTGRRRSRTGRG